MRAREQEYISYADVRRYARREGRLEEKRELTLKYVVNALQKGVPMSYIMAFSELSEEEIEEIRHKYL